jgi:UDP-N-acetylmuramoyl-tripeptide--D-alanyl-D-alanine ligase
VNGPAVSGLGLGLAVCALALAYVRWLRVAQREHYLPGCASRFAYRWWGASPINILIVLAGAAGAVASIWYPLAGFAAVIAAAVGPLGLTLRGRTSKLVWTDRLRRLAAASLVLAALPIAGLAIVGVHAAFSAAALCAMGAPFLVDLALLLMKWPEARLLQPYVQRARERLATVNPRVVAITGSYGKTTTKGYVAHLAAGSMSVVASTASFNNTPGLATAINNYLTTGTKVFVAEMGTYGPGEIAAMCAWTTPEIGVITAIGPVHLERMGSLERIAEAKSEILEKARVAILNVDYPWLAELAQKAQDKGKVVWRCSAQSVDADVSVMLEQGNLHVRTSQLRGEMDVLVATGPEVEPGNVACAVAAALSLGVPSEVVASRLAALPGPPNRRNARQSPKGVSIIDDTYNANPAGANAAVALLEKKAAKDGQKVVVTPGMVELGPIQASENAKFAAGAAAVATRLVVVGRTNARALVEGAGTAGLPTQEARNLAEAVDWVTANLGPGDAVLYENDLPDHYP